MTTTLPSQDLFSEEMLFSLSISAGEFAFSAQDARRSNGELHETSAKDQALRTLENLNVALKTAGLGLGRIARCRTFLRRAECRGAYGVFQRVDPADALAGKA